MMARYDIGDTVRVTGTFTNSAGVVQDPTTVALTVKKPSGVMTTYTYALAQVTKSSTGIYYYDVDATEAGRLYYRWVSTGSYKAAGEESFLISEAQAR